MFTALNKTKEGLATIYFTSTEGRQITMCK